MLFTVQTTDGNLVQAPRGAIKPTDLIVFDGPNAFASTEAIKQKLMEEIEAAGGLEAWRKKAQ